MANGPIHIALGVAWDSENPRQPPSVMSVPDEFHAILGRIITNWGLIEQEMEVLLTSLMLANSTHEAGWMKTPFVKRWALLQVEWKKFVSDNNELLREMQEISSQMSVGKYVRDCISHKRISAGIAENAVFIRFQNENKNFPWTKKYHLADLGFASLQVSDVVGRLYRLTNLEHASFFSPQSIFLLQQLPDTSHVRFPMPKGAQRQPRS